jgi:hypothetical protein
MNLQWENILIVVVPILALGTLVIAAAIIRARTK